MQNDNMIACLPAQLSLLIEQELYRCFDKLIEKEDRGNIKKGEKIIIDLPLALAQEMLSENVPWDKLSVCFFIMKFGGWADAWVERKYPNKEQFVLVLQA